jgi:hypothetical protein
MQDKERLTKALFGVIRQELADVDTLCRGTRIGENAEIDEIAFQLLLAVIEERFDVTVPSEDAAMMKRIGDLVDWITDRYQLPPPSRARLLWARLLSGFRKLLAPSGLG